MRSIEAPTLGVRLTIWQIRSQNPSESMSASQTDTPSPVCQRNLLIFLDFSAHFVTVVVLVVVGSKKDEMVELDLGKIGSNSSVSFTGVFNSQNHQVALRVVVEVLA